ncbi:hypothetical protein LJC34_05980 [Oscillospiraceae bacterium OttesenSCG-928-G22]|nr:hypothetical protein [Oscillospiraceae bacterium OttesenSCG-928-G22]
MTKEEKTLLVKQGVRLTALGTQVEAAREKLRRLVERGVSYNDPKMQKAYDHFEMLNKRWKALEQEHLALRRRLDLSDPK